MKSSILSVFVLMHLISFAQQKTATPTSGKVVAKNNANSTSLASVVNNNEILFTYGNNKVTASEFLSVYKKNNVGKTVDYSEKALGDYLKLYENFKLKAKFKR